MRSSGQSYRFWEFTIVLQYILIASFSIPWQTARGKPFYTSTSASEACLTALRFLLQRSNCMVWYDTCQCNCKSQLHHPFSNSETSLKSVVGRSLDELSQRHAPCLSFTPQRLGSKPSPWSNAFALAIFI